MTPQELTHAAIRAAIILLGEQGESSGGLSNVGC